MTALGLAGEGAPNRDGRAWRARGGVETATLACDTCLIGYVEAGAGEAVELRDGLAVYALASARLEAGDDINSVLSGVATVGAILRGETIAFAIEGGVQQGVDESDETLPFASAEVRFSLGRDWDLRAQFRHRDASEARLSFGIYW